MQVAKWHIFRGTNDEWYFRFIAANGERVAQSEGYHNYADAEHAIDLIEGALTSPYRQMRVLRRYTVKQ